MDGLGEENGERINLRDSERSTPFASQLGRDHALLEPDDGNGHGDNPGFFFLEQDDV
jgi:hypothetical protein